MRSGSFNDIALTVFKWQFLCAQKINVIILVGTVYNSEIRMNLTDLEQMFGDFVHPSNPNVAVAVEV